MSKFDKMNKFKLIYFVIFTLNLNNINAQISDKRLCVDAECTVPTSLAKTLLRYASPDSRILSFGPNVDVTIYSKSAGSKLDLWGAEINGKRGYVPKHMVRETKILQKPTILVNTESSNETENQQVPSPVEPVKVQEPYEVVDGTTIYLSPQEGISPSITETPVQPTALPVEASVGDSAEVHDSQEIKSSNEDQKISLGSQDTPNLAQVSETIKVVEQLVITEKVESESSSKESSLSKEDQSYPEGDDKGHISEEDEHSTEAVEEEERDPSEDKNTSTENVTPETTQVDSSSEIKADTISPVPNDAEENKAASFSESVITTEEPNAVLLDEKPKEHPETELPVVTEQVNTAEIINLDVTSVGTQNEVINEESIEDISETVVVPSIETTTLISDVEPPQPYDNSILEVTPNPVDIKQAESVQDAVETLPPLGIFAHSNAVDENIVENVIATVEDSLEVVVEEVKAEEQTHSEESVENVEDVGTGSEEDTGSSNVEETIGSGFLSGVRSFFSSGAQEAVTEEQIIVENVEPSEDKESRLEAEQIFEEQTEEQQLAIKAPALGFSSTDQDQNIHDIDSSVAGENFCDATTCPNSEPENSKKPIMDIFILNTDIFLYLITTAVSVIVFLFGYIAFDKSKRVEPLIAKINKLEKELLIVVKENQILQNKSPDSGYEPLDRIPNEVVEELKQSLQDVTAAKEVLEVQVQSLEKELENSTEVGLELNRMLSEILSSEGGSDLLKANVEHMQRQLVAQQTTVNTANESLTVASTENHELKLELELSNKKVLDLQAELDKLLLNVIKIEEEKENQQVALEKEITKYRQKCEDFSVKLRLNEDEFGSQLRQATSRAEQSERKLELKIKEYETVTEALKQLKNVKNKDESTLQKILEVSGMKAELQLLKSENLKFSEKLQEEHALKVTFEKQALTLNDELNALKEKYDESDKIRLEAQTKLEVLSNYFKDREAQWQKDMSKHEALWAEREGEATSTTERIKFMQEQLQNYKSQTESLKQEIMSQEIELKSQISVLDKKVHENWVGARQAERKLEDAKQEAALLRHRLTLKERGLQEDKIQHRLQSPIEQNGDLSLESPASPPLLFGSRDHITKSPPLPGLPPFLPPPHGVPFMPPPPFIPPPPPNMFPGDHRPPPLGRMSSPPLNPRYSPSSRGYSPYDRNSTSPSDSEYGTSPPQRRGYSPFNSRSEERRDYRDYKDYKRPPPGRTNGRGLMKGGSSGSGHSNESLEKINRQQSKV